jgi:sulfate adenylyltransferase
MLAYSESLLIHFRRAEELKQEALHYPSIDLNRRQLCDLELLLNRAFYPLKGYLNRADYDSVLDRLRLADNTVWPIPICLDVNDKTASSLSPCQKVAINDEEGFMLAVLDVEEIWQPDKRREALLVYGTDDPEAHPGVRHLLQQSGDWYIGGSLEGLHLPLHYDFKEIRLTPAETSRRFAQNGWRRVLGFHTDDYLHCAHREMVFHAAREANATILLQPVVGLDHPGNIDHYTHVRCYEEIVKKFPPNMAMLSLIAMAYRWAGPREALWQAIIKKNFGCSHFLVAAGHGDPFACQPERAPFYPLHAAQELVKKYQAETGIVMVPVREMVYAEDRAQYLLKDEADPKMPIKTISSVELKRRLEEDIAIPEWFSYPEVVAELRRAFPPRAKQGFTVFITGLSGSGKSTLAKVLMVKFMEMRDRPVTLLDGDIVRRNLSSELNFTKEHRNLNITRIGFVASEITKNGGIALCAPIAPYEESRQANRELISRYGGYIEVYISTPLAVCEQRDRKGLYAKARAGKIKGVTGVTDPYFPPVHPDLIIDTSEITPAEGAQEILLYLAEQRYIQ